MSVCALAHSNYFLQLIQRDSPSRSLSFAIAVRLAKQVNVASQFLRRALHLTLQLLVLCLAHPFGESGPYRLKVNG